MPMKRATKRCETGPAAKDYREQLHESLRDPEEAAAYLNAAIEDGDEQVFLLALRDVAEALGIGELARNAQLSRESTYRLLSKQGNPRLSSLWALLDAMGLKLSIETR